MKQVADKSADSRDGLLWIAPLARLSNALPETQRVYVLQFPADADVARLVDLYGQNEHIAQAEPVPIFPTIVGGSPTPLRLLTWGRTKRLVFSHLNEAK